MLDVYYATLGAHFDIESVEKGSWVDRLDHIAIQVSNLEETLSWYLKNFNAKMIYQDDTWAMIEFDNIKLAFVLATEHPSHIAFEKSQKQA